ncbi:hypothetical protein ACQEVF_44145 [Nonomuraea polychroma]|uniref:hypothetical protein n=1 Tax=Nonomuraea polychroma TaxID=46176 RepID=UPI003D8D65D3
MRPSARKGELRIRGKGRDGGKICHLPVHPDLRQTLQDWLDARADRKGAHSAAVFPNQRGGRLPDRDIITSPGESSGINDDPTAPFGPHVLRHPAHPRRQRPRPCRRTPRPRLPRHQAPLRLPTEADKAAALDAAFTVH